MESFASGKNFVDFGKPSFFDKVSEKMSKVFSTERTSTRVASTAAKGQIYSQVAIEEKSHTARAGGQRNPGGQSQGRMQLQLTINPCSKDSLYPKKNSVSLRAQSNPRAFGQQNQNAVEFNVGTSDALISPISNRSSQYQYCGEDSTAMPA